MNKYDYSQRAREIADQILDLAADLNKILLVNEREEKARSARGRLAVLAGGSLAELPAQDPESDS